MAHMRQAADMAAERHNNIDSRLRADVLSDA